MRLWRSACQAQIAGCYRPRCFASAATKRSAEALAATPLRRIEAVSRLLDYVEEPAGSSSATGHSEVCAAGQSRDQSEFALSEWLDLVEQSIDCERETKPRNRIQVRAEIRERLRQRREERLRMRRQEEAVKADEELSEIRGEISGAQRRAVATKLPETQSGVSHASGSNATASLDLQQQTSIPNKNWLEVFQAVKSSDTPALLQCLHQHKPDVLACLREAATGLDIAQAKWLISTMREADISEADFADMVDHAISGCASDMTEAEAFSVWSECLVWLYEQHGIYLPQITESYIRRATVCWHTSHVARIIESLRTELNAGRLIKLAGELSQQEHVEQALMLLEMLKDHAWWSLALCEELLVAYIRLGRTESITSLVREMTHHEIMPTRSTFNRLLSTAYDSKRFELGDALVDVMRDHRIEKDDTTHTIIVRGLRARNALGKYYDVLQKDAKAWQDDEHNGTVPLTSLQVTYLMQSVIARSEDYNYAMDLFQQFFGPSVLGLFSLGTDKYRVQTGTASGLHASEAALVVAVNAYARSERSNRKRLRAALANMEHLRALEPMDLDRACGTARTFYNMVRTSSELQGILLVSLVHRQDTEYALAYIARLMELPRALWPSKRTLSHIMSSMRRHNRSSAEIEQVAAYLAALKS